MLCEEVLLVLASVELPFSKTPPYTVDTFGKIEGIAVFDKRGLYISTKLIFPLMTILSIVLTSVFLKWSAKTLLFMLRSRLDFFGILFHSAKRFCNENPYIPVMLYLLHGLLVGELDTIWYTALTTLTSHSTIVPRKKIKYNSEGFFFNF